MCGRFQNAACRVDDVFLKNFSVFNKDKILYRFNNVRIFFQERGYDDFIGVKCKTFQVSFFCFADFLNLLGFGVFGFTDSAGDVVKACINFICQTFDPPSAVFC